MYKNAPINNSSFLVTIWPTKQVILSLKTHVEQARPCFCVDSIFVTIDLSSPSLREPLKSNASSFLQTKHLNNAPQKWQINPLKSAKNATKQMLVLPKTTSLKFVWSRRLALSFIKETSKE